MDKVMLARMLAPIVMQALNKAPTLMSNLEASGSEDMLQNVVSSLQNQQDPMLMEDLLTKPRIDTSGNIWPPMSATDLDYHLDIDNPQQFESDFNSGLDIITQAERMQQYPFLNDMYAAQEQAASENPNAQGPSATAYAALMLNHGLPNDAEIPNYPGGISELDRLSTQIDNAPDSKYKTDLVNQYNKKSQPVKLKDLYYQLLQQNSYK